MSKKKYKPEDIKRFIHAFAWLFAKDAALVLVVDVTHIKNRFFLGIKTKQGDVYRLDDGHYDHLGTIGYLGTIGKFNTLFEKANPRILLRRQVIPIEDLFNVFGLDENAVYETLFNKIKSTISSTISKGYASNGKMHFTCYYDNSLSTKVVDEIAYDLGPTPDVSSIDELMVLADMHAGV